MIPTTGSPTLDFLLTFIRSARTCVFYSHHSLQTASSVWTCHFTFSVFSPLATYSRAHGALTGTALHSTGCAPKSTISPKFVPCYPSNLFYILFSKLEFHTIGVLDGQVLKESFKLYRAINDGIINLVDKVSVIRCALFVEF